MWDNLVLLLIISPVDPAVPAHASPEAWRALKEVSRALEVVGPHESWGNDFSLELAYVRTHFRDTRDAPPLAHAGLFPGHARAAEMCCFNRRFQCHLEMQQVVYLYHYDYLGAVLTETRQLHEVWSCARQAGCETESWPNRRRALRRLLETVGPESYYAGKLPAPVPVERFSLRD